MTGDVVKKIYSFMSVGDRVKRGFKKLPGVEDTDLLVMNDPTDKHGLLGYRRHDLVRGNEQNTRNRQGLCHCAATQKRKFNGIPRITASTIHGAKGGEAENVVLFTDISPAADEEMRRNPDDMHRVFYVGVTRTKQNLYIVEPEDVSRSYDL